MDLFKTWFYVIEWQTKMRCLVRVNVLTADSMKKNKLQCHLETNHPGWVSNPLELLSVYYSLLQCKKLL